MKLETVKVVMKATDLRTYGQYLEQCTTFGEYFWTGIPVHQHGLKHVREQVGDLGHGLSAEHHPGHVQEDIKDGGHDLK